ncbi:MAG TPA: LysR family transcriptional regulator [Noviherbaspirillum sp.]|nr:LysR family transcriptional regulator [Noviherbaspirillum sp.]
MDLKALRYFAEIVRYGSFGKASEAIPLSQPALSKSIRLLEEELGVTLLERGPRGVGARTTAAGEIVLKRAHAMLRERDQLLEDLGELRGLKQGWLKVGLPPIASAALFADLITQYRDRYPGIGVELREEGSEGLEVALRSGAIEVAATLLPVRADLDFLYILTEPMMLVMSRHHPLAKRKRVRLAELKDAFFVMLDGGYLLNRMLEEACAANGFIIKEAARTAQLDFALALVAADAGIMCLPKIVARRHATEGISFVPIACRSLDWNVALAWRKGAELSHAAGAWLDLVRETLGHKHAKA